MKYLHIIGLGFLVLSSSLAHAREYHKGPRGGCYYYNSNTNKIYVEHYKCNNNYTDPAPTPHTKKYASTKTKKSYTIQNPVYTISTPSPTQIQTSTLTSKPTTKEVKTKDTIPEMTEREKEKYTQAQWETLQSHKLIAKEYNKRTTKHRATLLSRYNRPSRSDKGSSSQQSRQKSTTNRSNRSSQYGKVQDHLRDLSLNNLSTL